MEELQSGAASASDVAEPVPTPAETPMDPPPVEAGAAAEPAVETPPVVVPLVEGGRRYETLMILPIRYEGPAFEPLDGEIRKVYEAGGAAIASIDVIGRRALASKVKKQSEGIYVNVVFSALPAAISAIERDLGHMEAILRFLTTVKE